MKSTRSNRPKSGRASFFAALVLVLASCGGGSSDGGDPPTVPPTTPPGTPPVTPPVEPPPPPPAADVVFSSDWSTAGGRSDEAIRDAGKTAPWDVYNNYVGANLLSVVPATGRGFPARMANVLAVEYRGENSGDVNSVGRWPAPVGVDQFLYFRLYVRNEMRANAIGASEVTLSHHPWQPADLNCLSEWTWHTGQPNASGRYEVFFQRSVQPSASRWWRLPDLNRNTTYRFEWRLGRDSRGYRADFRIYGPDDVTLLYDNDDFRSTETGTTLAAWYAAGNRLTAFRASCMNSWFLGNNGPSGWAATGEFMYYGGAQVRTRDWPGPY